MADSKVSALAALAGADVAQTSDCRLIVDTSVATDKKLLVSELSLAMNVNGTQQATTSGTEFDFTIPAWATRVTLMGAGLSTNGTSPFIVQLGDGGGIETSTYLGSNVNQSGTVTAFTSGFLIAAALSATRLHEVVVELKLENAAAFTWMGASSMGEQSGVNFASGCGRKSTSAAMTTVRLTTVNGTDAFDAGAANVLYS